MIHDLEFMKNFLLLIESVFSLCVCFFFVKFTQTHTHTQNLTTIRKINKFQNKYRIL